jgi:hypothetical protein
VEPSAYPTYLYSLWSIFSVPRPAVESHRSLPRSVGGGYGTSRCFWVRNYVQPGHTYDFLEFYLRQFLGNLQKPLRLIRNPPDEVLSEIHLASGLNIVHWQTTQIPQDGFA